MVKYLDQRFKIDPRNTQEKVKSDTLKGVEIE